MPHIGSSLLFSSKINFNSNLSILVCFFENSSFPKLYIKLFGHFSFFVENVEEFEKKYEKSLINLVNVVVFILLQDPIVKSEFSTSKKRLL